MYRTRVTTTLIEQLFFSRDSCKERVIYSELQITAKRNYYKNKGRQCKAEREWYTPHQSEDQSPTTPTHRQKEEKGKKSRRLQ